MSTTITVPVTVPSLPATIVLEVTQASAPPPPPVPTSSVFLSESPYGATAAMFHSGTMTPWDNVGGDWTDASGAAQGPVPFASIPTKAGAVSADITTLVKAGPVEIMLQSSLKPADFIFIDGRATAMPPSIAATYTDGSTDTLACLANICLDPSTVYEVTASPLRCGPMHVVMRFAAPLKTVKAAVLNLNIDHLWYTNGATLNVFKLAHPTDKSTVDATPALPLTDPAIIFKADFASGVLADYYYKGLDVNNMAWYDETLADKTKYPAVSAGKLAGSPDGGYPGTDARIVDATDASAQALGFVPRRPGGKALMFTRGANMMYLLACDAKGALPEELWSHQSIMLANDFVMPDGDPQNGGKFAGGFCHVTSSAGNGGNMTDGLNGWTMRNQFIMDTAPGDFAHQKTMMGEYCYTKDLFQQQKMWGLNGILERGKWYDIGHHMKLNTPGIADGLMEVLINGRLIFRKSDFLWRMPGPYASTTRGNNLGISQWWWNWYFGGVWPDAPKFYMHCFLAEPMIASKPIGSAFGA